MNRTLQVAISPYTKKMLRIETAMKGLLALCALLVIGFLLVLIGYLSLRGLFVRHQIRSAVLPDYQTEFPWPSSAQVVQLWLSPSIDLGKLRADQLYDIISGKEKNWVQLAESKERLRLLLTEQQAQAIQQAHRKTWHQSRTIKIYPSTEQVATALLRTPGALAILPATGDWQAQWDKQQQASKRPRLVSLAVQGLVLDQHSQLPEDKLLQPDSAGGQKTEWSLLLKQVRRLLREGAAGLRTVPYNWLNGQIELPALGAAESRFVPLQLRYREYQILKLRFLLQPPAKNGKVGGISTLLLSSLILVLVSLLGAVPLGLAVAIFLVEYAEPAQSGPPLKNRPAGQQTRGNSLASWAKMVHIAIQTLSGIPSIIFGLFGSIVFVPLFGISLLSGAATLALMLLPTIILTAKEALLTVPKSYIEGSLGLGAQKWYTIWRISLPSALPGILGGIILAIGRALGETAALIYTLGTGYQAALSRFPQLLRDWPELWQQFWLAPSLGRLAQIATDYPLLDLHSSLRSVSLHLYWMTINGISLQKGFSTAFVLIFVIVLLNLGARGLLLRFSARSQEHY